MHRGVPGKSKNLCPRLWARELARGRVTRENVLVALQVFYFLSYFSAMSPVFVLGTGIRLKGGSGPA